MKKNIINILLIIIIVCLIALYFDNYYMSKVVFERSIEEFEAVVESGDTYNTIMMNHYSDNSVSLVCSYISDLCIKMSEFIIVFFSNFISMIL